MNKNIASYESSCNE